MRLPPPDSLLKQQNEAKSVVEAAKRNCYSEQQQSLSIVIPSDSAGIQLINNSTKLQRETMNNLTETVFSRFTSHVSLPKVAFTLAEGATHVALSDKSRKSAFTLDESFTHVAHCDKFRRAAFTLAEVLITLGIIGVVAALTLPTIINKAQSMILKNQFRKAYSTLHNAINLVQVQNGAPLACYYWAENPYEANGNGTICTDRNEYGSCTHYTLKDGSPIPNDYNGDFSDCIKFHNDFMKTLKTVKFCQKEALKNGCLTDNYRGTDIAWKSMGTNNTSDPNTMYSDSKIKNVYSAFLTADGILYIRYNEWANVPAFTFDINGHRGPNKWGYDLFSFVIKGNKTDGMTGIKPMAYVVEKGGKSMEQMMRDF